MWTQTVPAMFFIPGCGRGPDLFCSPPCSSVQRALPVKHLSEGPCSGPETPCSGFLPQPGICSRPMPSVCCASKGNRVGKGQQPGTRVGGRNTRPRPSPGVLETPPGTAHRHVPPELMLGWLRGFLHPRSLWKKSTPLQSRCKTAERWGRSEKQTKGV